MMGNDWDHDTYTVGMHTCVMSVHVHVLYWEKMYHSNAKALVKNEAKAWLMHNTCCQLAYDCSVRAAVAGNCVLELWSTPALQQKLQWTVVYENWGFAVYTGTCTCGVCTAHCRVLYMVYNLCLSGAFWPIEHASSAGLQAVLAHDVPLNIEIQ